MKFSSAFLALTFGAATGFQGPAVSRSSTALFNGPVLGAGGMADTRDPDAQTHDDPRKSIGEAPSFEEYLKQRSGGGAAPAAPAPAAAAPAAPAPAPAAWAPPAAAPAPAAPAAWSPPSSWGAPAAAAPPAPAAAPAWGAPAAPPAPAAAPAWGAPAPAPAAPAGGPVLGAGGMADTRDPDAQTHEDPRKSIGEAPSFEEYMKMRS